MTHLLWVKMHIKDTKTHHYMPIRSTQIKKPNTIRAGEETEQLEVSCDCKFMQPL